MSNRSPFRMLLPLVALLSGCAVDAIENAPEGDPNAVDEGDPDPGAPDQTSEGTSVDGIAASGIIDAEEAAFLSLINNYRAQHGAPALRISVALTRAAHLHSQDMATRDYFAHESLDGREFTDRIRAQGYTYNTYLGENLAAGNSGARRTFEQLRDECDPDASGRCTYAHRVTMLDPNFRVIGIARVYNATAESQWYWTTDFGGTVDAVFSYGTGTILANGGFESATLGSAGWSSVRTRGGWYTSNAQRGSSSPQYGSRQLTVSDPDPGGASATQIVLGAPGVAYTFTAFSRRSSGSGQRLYLEFLDGNYARLAIVSAASAANSTYAGSSVGLVAPAGTKYVRAFVYGPTTSGVRSQFAYDTVSLSAE